MNKSDVRNFKVTLSKQDSQRLKEMADKLGITESDVLRKGLKLMSVYANTNEEEEVRMLIRDKKKGNDTELLVI